MTQEEQKQLNYMLIDAATSGDLNAAKESIKMGADVNATNSGRGLDANIGSPSPTFINQNPLQEAVKNGHLDVVKYLVENGANIHANNDLALTYAAINNHLDAVKYLIKMGSGVCVANNVLKNPIYDISDEIIQLINLCTKDDKLSKNLVKIMIKDV